MYMLSIFNETYWNNVVIRLAVRMAEVRLNINQLIHYYILNIGPCIQTTLVFELRPFIVRTMLS